MRRANRCTRYPSKDDILKIFVKCGWSSLTEVSPPAPRPVDCKAYQLLPFSSADSLVIIGDISAFCTPWLIPLCPHPPLVQPSTRLVYVQPNAGGTQQQRGWKTKANFAKDPLCRWNALPVGKSGTPPGTEPHLSFLLSRTCGALQSCTSTST